MEKLYRKSSLITSTNSFLILVNSQKQPMHAKKTFENFQRDHKEDILKETTRKSSLFFPLHPVQDFSAGFCIFQEGTCSGVVSHFSAEKTTFCIWGENAYLKRNWSNTMKLPIFVFVGNPINKNGAIVWKGYHNVIHFSIIGNFTSVCTLSITSLDIFRLGYILSHSMV